VEKALTWAAKLALGTAMVVGAIAGCGGGAEPATTEAAPLSPEEYQAQLEGALQPMSDELSRIQSESATETSPEGLAGALGEMETALQTAVDDLSAITPPEELAAPHDQLIAAFEDFNQGTAEARGSLEEDDVQAFGSTYQEATLQLQQDLATVDQEFQREGVDLSSALGAPQQ
jgi:hypothetical protein